MRSLSNTPYQALIPILSRYQLQLTQVSADSKIPHSFWGSPEAGRLKSTLYARVDSPIHSILHETCPYICMPPDQRSLTQVDAVGSALVESACCYLQIVLADHIEGINRQDLMHDMDTWGYSFRLGSTARWFFADSEDARQWLIEFQILNTSNYPTLNLRSHA